MNRDRLIVLQKLLLEETELQATCRTNRFMGSYGRGYPVAPSGTVFRGTDIRRGLQAGECQDAAAKITAAPGRNWKNP
jgi:hypothetical protein